jgi:hypothetical protein
MYAMDQTMHFEHRAEERRPRWELRRPGQRSTTTAATLTVAPAQQGPIESDSNPAHAFLD